jgi:acetyl esterase
MSSVVLRSIASTHSQSLRGAVHIALPDADMRHLLGVLAALEPKPIDQCSPAEARAQPTLSTALNMLLRERHDDSGVGMELRMIPGPGGDMRARVYVPPAHDMLAPAPIILYLHGGGFVIGDLDRDDETPRALARRCGAVVVSAHYRLAPEFKFPAAHEDALAAWQWMIAHAASLGADPARAAIVGEDAGGNLALNVALHARDEVGVHRPKHLALISPMAATDFGLPSYIEQTDGMPFRSATIQWFYKKALRGKAGMDDPRLNLVDRSDLEGLPPTTIVLAGLDPLRSEGELLADALRRSGVWVDSIVYDGVTAQFFGLARMVNKAIFAQGQVARNLSESLA